MYADSSILGLMDCMLDQGNRTVNTKSPACRIFLGNASLAYIYLYFDEGSLIVFSLIRWQCSGYMRWIRTADVARWQEWNFEQAGREFIILVLPK